MVAELDLVDGPADEAVVQAACEGRVDGDADGRCAPDRIRQPQHRGPRSLRLPGRRRGHLRARRSRLSYFVDDIVDEGERVDGMCGIRSQQDDPI